MRVISISAKCSDMFSANLLGKEYNGYVPRWFSSPNVQNDGDYVILDIDVDTGKIVNWKKPTLSNLEETFKTT